MEIFGPEYLRKPTMTDVVKLYRHHEEKHGFRVGTRRLRTVLLTTLMWTSAKNGLWTLIGFKTEVSSNIKGIISDGIWRVDPDFIKHTDFKHFSSRFQECGLNRPSFSSTRFRPLSAMDTDSLEMPFSLDEVKEAVWGCAGSKALGLDVDPLCFSDYRPISLIGCAYKVISKVLANRLSKVIGSIISPNQLAFIAGRQILDGCLIANEVIRMANIEKLKLLLFKVDFEKAFDSVNWEFLLDIMRQMGF
ncbi:cysteine-rich receptor-like protein kinase, partial [Tanacetum coccineum]